MCLRQHPIEEPKRPRSGPGVRLRSCQIDSLGSLGDSNAYLTLARATVEMLAALL